jgi:hypothetical protein
MFRRIIDEKHHLQNIYTIRILSNALLGTILLGKNAFTSLAFMHVYNLEAIVKEIWQLIILIPPTS